MGLGVSGSWGSSEATVSCKGLITPLQLQTCCKAFTRALEGRKRLLDGLLEFCIKRRLDKGAPNLKLNLGVHCFGL